MASRWKLGMGFVKLENVQCGEESSESENESDTVKPFVRKLSTNRNIKSSVSKKKKKETISILSCQLTVSYSGIDYNTATLIKF